jgi:hypothetical protein
MLDESSPDPHFFVAYADRNIFDVPNQAASMDELLLDQQGHGSYDRLRLS